MKGLHVVSWILVIIGGLNWLVQGIFVWDIGLLFGEANNLIARIVYILVGLAAIVLIFTHKKSCKECASSDAPASSSM